MFKVMRSGKRQKKQWKRMLTKVTFVGGAFTRKPPKYERFIRPTGSITARTRIMVGCRCQNALIDSAPYEAHACTLCKALF